MCGKPNEQLFPRQVVLHLPTYVIHIIGETKYKYGQQEQVKKSAFKANEIDKKQAYMQNERKDPAFKANEIDKKQAYMQN